MATPRERLEALRQEQGNIESVDTPRQKLEKLRVEQGDTNGEGQGVTPSRNPVFEEARKNGFLKGYLDQASGVSQILDHLKSPNIDKKVRELQGFENVEVMSMDEFIEKEENIYQKNRKDKGLTGFDWARLGGNIVNPVSIGTMTSLPLRSTAGIATKMASGGAIGSVAGLSQPDLSTEGDFLSDKALQASLGLGVGALAQPVISGIKGAFDFGKYLARPFNKTGQMKDVAELYSKLAGDSKKQIIRALDTAKTRVTGNKPTAGQAIAEGTLKMRDASKMTAEEMVEAVKSGNFANEGLPTNFGSSIVKLENELRKIGTTGDELKTVLYQQMHRRSSALKEMVNSTDEALNSAIQKRHDATAPLYKAVEESKKLVRTGDVLKKVRVLIQKNINEDGITIPMRKILSKLKQGDLVETNPQNLYSLSKQIKAMIESKTPNGSSEFNVKALSEVKKLLDKAIGKGEPAFAKAQYLFKEHSQPINQIKVAREFGDALESSLKEESARPFLTAMDNAVKTLKKSTGFARFKKLEDVMTPKQIGVLNKVRDELVREGRANKIATGTKTVVKELQDGIEISLPNMLSRPMMLANAVLRMISKDMSPAYEKLAIKIQQDPKFLAELLRKTEVTKERKMVIELLNKYSAMLPSQELSRNEIIK